MGSLSTRLDKLEAALRGRDGGGPPDGPWLVCRLIYDPLEWDARKTKPFPGEGDLGEIDRERISRMKTDKLDRLVGAGRIKEIDREYVRFIVRRIVQPPERPDDPLPEKAVEGG
jgi:hypothetical protein